MFLGYNTNGLAHHELFDAVQLVADLGYRGIALTIDHGVLSPRAAATADQLEQLRRTLRAAGLRSVIETGARFLLDPRRKHEPTLVSPRIEDRRRRIEFYRHAIRCAQRLESRCVSIWSGAVREEAADADLFARLIEGLEEVLNDAARQGVAIALEPEPGMFIDSQRRFAELVARFPCESLLLTLDVGHLHCQGETPIGEQVRRWKSRLVNVHLDDSVAGRHEHLLFGGGQIEFAPLVDALAEIGYSDGLYVELSRHSHIAPDAARAAFDFLDPLIRRHGHHDA
ncbi:MAG: sugar phosphate isomerase/epimerase [Pirellulales bacterium]|jgi:sugar phosphate isomerase/epimerase|nr:sugar phosphate isomerase/epimerase [Thermoguttaceae bacterium]MDD4785617.1 sugar phosphate isomerase/epimerase [Pirellulales bacterium]MDI9442887.1 sugar phosphate isomerase/epimerase family protein [Planctomycetota bacterium]NLZ01389.1 sugar phosphate isomerase/epimerase [Pirellulaceae bacterium]